MNKKRHQRRRAIRAAQRQRSSRSPTFTPTESAADAAFPIFPLSIGATRRTRRLRRVLIGLATVAALVGGGVAIAAAASGETVSYRTAPASTRQVASTLDGVASIEPVSQATLAFPTAGTVTTVAVAVGDTVTAGQTLATIDTASLEQAVREAQAALDQAELVLQTALDGEDPATLQGSQGGGAIMGISSTGSAGVQLASLQMSSSTQTVTVGQLVAVDQDEIRAAQQAVIDAQQQVSGQLTAAANALSSAEAVCAAVGADPAADPADTSAITSCQAALNAALSAQRSASDAQAALANAANSLDELLAERAQELEDAANTTTTTSPDDAGTPDETSTTSPSPSASDTTTSEPPASSIPDDEQPSGSIPSDDMPSGEMPSGGAPSGGAPSGGGPSGGGSTTASSYEASSEDLISYQSAVDAAEADLVAAEHAVARASVVTPIDGTVISVGLAVGDDVTAGSTEQTIVVQGTGGYEATMLVSIDDIGDIDVGMAATVTQDGSTIATSGEVVAVSPVPSDASTTSTSYAVVIALTGDTSALRNGAIGSASIITGNVESVLAVPTSAITVNGDIYTVTVLDAVTGTTSSTPVEVGVIGDTWTEIDSGLDEGQDVVIADLTAPLPGTASDSTSSDTPGGFSGPPAMFGGS